MPTVKMGEMWSIYDQPDILFVITTNAYVLKGGNLVMGRGIAYQARQRIPGIDYFFGSEVAARAEERPGYGLIVPRNYPDFRVAAFQTKAHFKDPARLDLIAHSTQMLRAWAERHSSISIHMNFPGIGYGSLRGGEVWPLIRDLPANVTIWRR